MHEMKVIVVVAPDVALKSAALERVAAKAVFFGNYAPGETGVESLAGMAALPPDAPALAIHLGEGHAALLRLDAGSFAAGLAAVAEVRDRRTLLAVIGADGALFSGAGVSRERRESDRPSSAADIVPTLCYMAGLPVPEGTRGAVLYEAMKDPDLPHTRIAALQASLDAMEYAIERNRREPWDKHDCA